MASPTARGFWGTFARVFFTFVLITLIGLAVMLQVVPRILGGTSLTVLTGSMQPTINPGDVIAVRAISADEVRVGDVVTFQPVSGDPTLVTHRVIAMAIGPDGMTFTTQGDANNTPDDPIVAEQIQGVYMYRAPYLGYVLQAVGGGGPAVMVLGAVLFMAALVLIFWPARRQRAAPVGRGPTTLTVAGLAATGLAVSALVLAPAPAARAVDEPLVITYAGPALSLDWQGNTVSQNRATIFGDRTVVPGDRIARALNVTNASTQGNILTVRLSSLRSTGDPGFGGALLLQWTDAAGPIGSGSLAEVGPLSGDIVLQPGQSRQITLVLSYPGDTTFPPAASTAATSTVEFDVEVLLTEGPGPLPPTGGVIPLGGMVFALAALSAGITAMIRMRHARRHRWAASSTASRR